MGIGDDLVRRDGKAAAGNNPPAGFDKRINDFKAGDSIEVTLFSNDKIKQVKLTLSEQQSGKLVLKGDAKATKQQKAFFKTWLGIDWPFDNKGELATKA